MKLIHPGDRHHQNAIINYIKTDTKQPYVKSMRLITRDGGIVWVRGSVSRYQYPDQGKMGYVVTWIEMTDIKLAEENYRIATEKLQAISDEVDIVLGYLQDGQFDFSYDSKWRQQSNFEEVLCID